MKHFGIQHGPSIRDKTVNVKPSISVHVCQTNVTLRPLLNYKLVPIVEMREQHTQTDERDLRNNSSQTDSMETASKSQQTESSHVSHL